MTRACVLLFTLSQYAHISVWARLNITEYSHCMTALVGYGRAEWEEVKVVVLLA